MDHTVIAIDIAKKVFQLHWVEPDTGSTERLQLRRARVLEWFANREPALVVMEACGGAHEWARALTSLGHEVRLICARKVRPFVQRTRQMPLTHKRSGLHASNRACALWP